MYGLKEQMLQVEINVYAGVSFQASYTAPHKLQPFSVYVLDDFLHSYTYSLSFSHIKLILDFKLALVLYG